MPTRSKAPPAARRCLSFNHKVHLIAETIQPGLSDCFSLGEIVSSEAAAPRLPIDGLILSRFSVER
jgi:hypothetical protein